MTDSYRPEIIQSAFMGFLGTQLLPFWSVTKPRLRLIARYVLSDELIALQFETNSAFRRQAFASSSDWQGGQHLRLSVAIEGIYYQRYYSLVGLFEQPEPLQQAILDGALVAPLRRGKPYATQKPTTVTIAIKPQGLVSNYLTQHAALGTVVDSSVPTGDFILARRSSIKTPQQNNAAAKPNAPLLFIAGGSGITPMLGLITQALQQNRQVTLLYYYRGAQTHTTSQTAPPFLSYWQHLVASDTAFDYHMINTNDANSYLAGSRYLSADGLMGLALPLDETLIYVCGSATLLSGLYRALNELAIQPDGAYASYSFTPHVIAEHFGEAQAQMTCDYTASHLDTAAPQVVHLRGRQQQFVSDSTLLVAAEHAGIRLAYGCRQGICQLCRCQKISGVVQNSQTGKLSSDGYESIQTCISIAMSEVVLDV